MQLPPAQRHQKVTAFGLELPCGGGGLGGGRVGEDGIKNLETVTPAFSSWARLSGRASPRSGLSLGGHQQGGVLAVGSV